MLSDDTPGYRLRKDFWIRLTFSIIAGIFITRFGQNVSFMAMFVLRGHLYALVSSILIAYLLFETVYRLSIFGDTKIKWIRYPAIRTGYQIVIGGGATCLLAFLMAKFYYQFAGYDILKTGYLRHIFPLTVVYIAAINVYYCWDKLSAELIPLLKRDNIPDQESPALRAALAEAPSQQSAAIIPDKNVSAEFIRSYVLEHDLVCLYIKNKSIWVRNSKNEPVKWNIDTITGSIHILPKDLYIQIKRDTIILTTAIEKIEEKEDKKIYIYLKGHPDPFHLAKERIDDFIAFGQKHHKDWIDAGFIKIS